MKKVFLVLAIASIFVACNDTKTDSTTTTDSTNLNVDSSAISAPLTTDSLTVDSSANKMSADTTKK